MRLKGMRRYFDLTEHKQTHYRGNNEAFHSGGNTVEVGHRPEVPRVRYSVNEMKANNRVRLAKAMRELDIMNSARDSQPKPAEAAQISEVSSLERRIRILFGR